MTESVDHRLRELDPLVERFARRFYRRLREAVPLSDLLAFAHEGAHGAATRWDGRGQFQSFAAQRIKWAILDGLRRLEKQNKQSKTSEPRFTNELTALTAVERAADALAPPGDAGLDADDRAAMANLLASAAAGYSLDLVVAVEDIDLAADDHVDVEREAERLRLRRAVSALPDLERTVVERHTYAGESFEEIAEAIGAKRSTVFDLYTRGTRRLHQEFGASGPQAP